MMEYWKWTAGVLCAFGLFKEFRPSESFFIEYAIDYGNFTADEIVHDILPVTTYGSLVTVFIFIFVTDFLRYRPVIIFGALAFVATWCVTIWGYTEEWAAEVRQVLNAVAVSSEVAYFTYMYANVERSHYKQVTSLTHTALHTGRFLGGLCGQLLLSYEVLGLDEINYLSLGGVSASLIVSLFLPTVKRSIYFYPSHLEKHANVPIEGNVNYTDDNVTKSPSKSTNKKILEKRPSLSALHHIRFVDRLKMAFPALWLDFKKAYSNRYVLKWSLWWSIAMAVYLQVGLYTESLWRVVEEETHQNVLNGAIDASHALLTAIITVGLGLFKFPWFRWGELYLSTISLLQGGALILMSQTHSLYAAYGAYIFFQTLFQVMIVIVTAEVAEGISEDSEAFIFGINTLLAFVIQSILTYALTSEHGFILEIRDEFVAYGIYSAILGLVFLLLALQNRRKHWVLPKTSHLTAT